MTLEELNQTSQTFPNDFWYKHCFHKQQSIGWIILSKCYQLITACQFSELAVKKVNQSTKWYFEISQIVFATLSHISVCLTFWCSHHSTCLAWVFLECKNLLTTPTQHPQQPLNSQRNIPLPMYILAVFPSTCQAAPLRWHWDWESIFKFRPGRERLLFCPFRRARPFWWRMWKQAVAGIFAESSTDKIQQHCMMSLTQISCTGAETIQTSETLPIQKSTCESRDVNSRMCAHWFPCDLLTQQTNW